MKKAIIASLVALTSGVAITAFALRGPDKLVDLRVNAEPQEYSVTFNASNTSCTLVEIYEEEYIAFTTTTDNGNKVGVVGCHIGEESFTFNDIPFRDLWLCDYDDVLEGRAYQFSTITGFAISYSSKEPEEPVFMDFTSMGKNIHDVKSGTPYTELSITRDHGPMFRLMEGSVTVTSLTIWYSC